MPICASKFLTNMPLGTSLNPSRHAFRGVFLCLGRKMVLHCDSFAELMFQTFLLFEVRLAPLSYFSLFLTKDFRKFVIYNKALYITIWTYDSIPIHPFSMIRVEIFILNQRKPICSSTLELRGSTSVV